MRSYHHLRELEQFVKYIERYGSIDHINVLWCREAIAINVLIVLHSLFTTCKLTLTHYCFANCDIELDP